MNLSRDDKQLLVSALHAKELELKKLLRANEYAHNTALHYKRTDHVNMYALHNLRLRQSAESCARLAASMENELSSPIVSTFSPNGPKLGEFPFTGPGED